MTTITILGKEYTVVDDTTNEDTIQLQKNTLIIGNKSKQSNETLRKYLIELLYNQLSSIYEEIKNEGKIEILGKANFDIVDKIDDKKNRIAKLNGNRILVKETAITLPEEVLKYIIAHELTHTFTKKHTERFWKIVEKICPNYREEQEMLQKYKEALC